jgi:hypothetical protein
VIDVGKLFDKLKAAWNSSPPLPPKKPEAPTIVILKDCQARLPDPPLNRIVRDGDPVAREENEHSPPGDE